MAKTKRNGDYRGYLFKSLKSPAEAAAYINAALEERDDPDALLVALRHIVEANNVSRLAESAGLNRVTLYRALSKGGNPRLDSLASLLAAVGLKLKVEKRAA